MKKQYLAVAIAVALIGGLVIFTSGNNNNSDQSLGDQPVLHGSSGEDSKHLANAVKKDSVDATDKSEVDVEINDFYYGTSVLTVKRGTKVTWTNRGDIRHDVKQAEGSPNNFESSSLLSSGENYSYVFDEVGDYYYFCSPHPTQMRAIVKVVD